jgi:AraC-like DNA-binding protein
MVTIDQGGARADVLRVSRPPAVLADVVDFFWVDAGASRERAAERWRIVADDAPHIVYAVSDTPAGPRSRINLVGARTTFADLDLTKRILTVGVRLRPGTLSALFGVPAHELTDGAIALADVLPRALRPMVRCIDDDGPDHATAHVMSLVRALLLIARAPDARASLIEHMRGDIDDVAAAFGISHRGLRDWSQRSLGMGIKRFLRIQRLHRAIQLACASPAVSWSVIAARAGYADQSHCIRDFRDLLGETPSAFMARGGTN